MNAKHTRRGFLASAALAATAAAVRGADDDQFPLIAGDSVKPAAPGRRARIATVCQKNNFKPTVQENLNYVMGLLDQALAQKPDLVCLPETFATVRAGKISAAQVEQYCKLVLTAAGKRAKDNRCYVVCPVKTVQNNSIYNSAVILDRSGQPCGTYNKYCPVTSSSDYTALESDITPGNTLPVFDLDFGRIAIQICFDAGFPESWQALANQGAKLVLWPSAYDGGFPLQVYAYLHHYYVISSVRVGKSKVIDPMGQILCTTEDTAQCTFRDVNLDFVVSHLDFNMSIPDKIQKAYGDRVDVRVDRPSGHFIVEPIDPNVSTAKLQAEFGFESTFQYHQRHRVAYKAARQGKAPTPQQAAHRDRTPYGK